MFIGSDLIASQFGRLYLVKKDRIIAYLDVIRSLAKRFQSVSIALKSRNNVRHANALQILLPPLRMIYPSRFLLIIKMTQVSPWRSVISATSFWHCGCSFLMSLSIILRCTESSLESKEINWIGNPKDGECSKLTLLVDLSDIQPLTLESLSPNDYASESIVMLDMDVKIVEDDLVEDVWKYPYIECILNQVLPKDLKLWAKI